MQVHCPVVLLPLQSLFLDAFSFHGANPDLLLTIRVKCVSFNNLQNYVIMQTYTSNFTSQGLAQFSILLTHYKLMTVYIMHNDV